MKNLADEKFNWLKKFYTLKNNRFNVIQAELMNYG